MPCKLSDLQDSGGTVAYHSTLAPTIAQQDTLRKLELRSLETDQLHKRYSRPAARVRTFQGHTRDTPSHRSAHTLLRDTIGIVSKNHYRGLSDPRHSRRTVRCPACSDLGDMGCRCLMQHPNMYPDRMQCIALRNLHLGLLAQRRRARIGRTPDRLSFPLHTGHTRYAGRLVLGWANSPRRSSHLPLVTPCRLDIPRREHTCLRRTDPPGILGIATSRYNASLRGNSSTCLRGQPEANIYQ